MSLTYVFAALIGIAIGWALRKLVESSERRRCADAAIVEPVPAFWQKALIHARARREAEKIRS
jgi:hypothetical protein